MKNIGIIALFWLTILLFHTTVMAQKTSLDNNSFDFWVGEWDLTWQKKDGTIAKGYNKVSKIMDDSVIQEKFEDLSSGFKGTSISVYNPKTGQWFQSWADKGGGFFSFYGEIEGEKRIFRTPVQQKDSLFVIRRMVFRDITEKTFVWDWEVSVDNGDSWDLKWQINYARRDK